MRETPQRAGEAKITKYCLLMMLNAEFNNYYSYEHKTDRMAGKYWLFN